MFKPFCHSATNYLQGAYWPRICTSSASSFILRITAMDQVRFPYFVLVWQLFLEQIESVARLAEFCSKRRCRIHRFRQLLLFYHAHVVSIHLEKALEDRKRSKDVSILVLELSSVARVHDTISCSLLEFTQPILTN